MSVSAVTSSPSASEIAPLTVLIRQSPEMSNSSSVPGRRAVALPYAAIAASWIS